ncbi:phage protein NinX family protein [Morganella morganii]
MNKYRNKSDFEINKAVAEKVGIMQYMFDGKDSESVIWNVPSNNIYNGFISKKGWDFDPCNNPDDAMPIVLENGISLIFDTGCKAWVAGIAYWVDGCEWQISYEVERMNQYRAAMELFLMMKDAENEK